MRSSDDRDLQRYFDGELSPRAARRVCRQLDPDARRRLESLGQMRDMVRETAEATADDADFAGLWDGVRRGIAGEQRAGWSERLRRWFRLHRLATASAAAAMAVIALVLVVVLPRAIDGIASNDCVIESLDVGEGAVSTIFTIDDPERADATTVIWVSESSGEGEL